MPDLIIPRLPEWAFLAASVSSWGSNSKASLVCCAESTLLCFTMRAWAMSGCLFYHNSNVAEHGLTDKLSSLLILSHDTKSLSVEPVWQVDHPIPWPINCFPQMSATFKIIFSRLCLERQNASRNLPPAVIVQPKGPCILYWSLVYKSQHFHKTHVKSCW